MLRTEHHEHEVTELWAVPESLQLYLKQACQAPRLSAEEEVALARRLAKGDEEARDAMIKGNLRLVLHIAKRYTGRGVPLPDLVSEGNIGLDQAVKRFDPTLGIRFSTYAAWWIKEKIKGAIADTATTIRVPRHLIKELRDLDTAVKRLTIDLEREPSVAELATELGVCKENIKSRFCAVQVKLTTSLYAPAEHDASMEIHETLDDPMGEVAQEALQSREQLQFIRAIVGGPEHATLLDKMLAERAAKIRARLEPREIDILCKRYGVDRDGREALSLEEVGRGYQLTRERIRQIEAKAIKKLRAVLQ